MRDLGQRNHRLRIDAMGYNSDLLFCASRGAIQEWETTLLLVARLYFASDNTRSDLHGTLANIQSLGIREVTIMTIITILVFCSILF